MDKTKSTVHMHSKFLLEIHIMKSPFLTMIAEQMYLKRYAKSTIKAYLYWIASFIRFNSMSHPTTMGDNEVELFLAFLNSFSQPTKCCS